MVGSLIDCKETVYIPKLTQFNTVKGRFDVFVEESIILIVAPSEENQVFYACIYRQTVWKWLMSMYDFDR